MHPTGLPDNQYTIRKAVLEGGYAALNPLQGGPLLHEELEACCLGARTRIVGFALLYVVRSLCFKAEHSMLEDGKTPDRPVALHNGANIRPWSSGGCLGLASFW